MSTVLVVEDEALIRELAVEELTDAGFIVSHAPDGVTAVQMLETGAQFDVLVTDIRMPGSIDGWELGRVAASLLPAIKIIYVTGYSATNPPLNQHERFIRKPSHIDDILETLVSLGIMA